MRSSSTIRSAEDDRRRSDRPDALNLVFVEDRPAVAEALASFFVDNQIAATAVARLRGQLLDGKTLESADVLILDVGAVPARIADEAAALLARAPALALVAVTNSIDSKIALGLKSAGFRGLVRRDALLSEFTSVVMSVARGGLSFPEESQGHREDEGVENAHALFIARHLTFRERQVLRLLVSGASSEEMASELGIKRGTVRTHIQNIMTKLQVHSRVQAVMFAVRHGLVTVGERDTG
jgi:two-component system, NarL family, nitrate/nitrite response regulator NarL